MKVLEIVIDALVTSFGRFVATWLPLIAIPIAWIVAKMIGLSAVESATSNERAALCIARSSQRRSRRPILLGVGLATYLAVFFAWLNCYVAPQYLAYKGAPFSMWAVLLAIMLWRSGARAFVTKRSRAAFLELSLCAALAVMTEVAWFWSAGPLGAAAPWALIAGPFFILLGYPLLVVGMAVVTIGVSWAIRDRVGDPSITVDTLPTWPGVAFGIALVVSAAFLYWGGRLAH